MLFSMRRVALAAFVLVHTRVEARNSTYRWSFRNESITNELASCDVLPVSILRLFDPVQNRTTFGTAPFSMVAFEIGGVTDISQVGPGRDGLAWTVRHKPGTRLLLGMVDAKGSPGPTSDTVYTVGLGRSASCLPPVVSTLRMSPNVTGTLAQCQPWGIRITGGVKPYTVTITVRGSPIVNNYTMSVASDQFTFINHEDPGEMLVAAISDVAGHFANGTASVITRMGPTNIDCSFHVTSEGTSTSSAVFPFGRDGRGTRSAIEAQASRAGAKNNASVIIITVVAPVMTLAICAFIGIYLCKRRRARKAAQGPDTIARAFDPEAQSITKAEMAALEHSQSASSSTLVLMTPQRRSESDPAIHGSSLRSTPNPHTLIPFPLGSRPVVSRIQGKQREPEPVTTTSSEPETVVQHQDLADTTTIPAELPPPYVDRSTRT